MIPNELEEQFKNIIEVDQIDWTTIDNIMRRDANIFRPIKGVLFEEYFTKLVSTNFHHVSIRDGEGDGDIDKTINGIRLQIKTIDNGNTVENQTVGVALHKTHGVETRPYNLYSMSDHIFDYLVIEHPESGIMIVPFNEIPENNNWDGYLADPVIFEWENHWINRWDLLGFTDYREICLDTRSIPDNSQLPFISSHTYLQDYEIVETLCRPENFRAAVMGLKGNLKELWFENYLIENNYIIQPPIGAYPKYDVQLKNSNGVFKKVQVKGTSKNMCKVNKRKIGFEVMGTHGQLPNRGYKKSFFDYVVCIISSNQIPEIFNLESEFHFVFIPVEDLPLHYLIGNGNPGQTRDWANERWNLEEFNDVIYPNIKLIFEQSTENGSIQLIPDITSYRSNQGFLTIPSESSFRTAGPYVLDRVPEEFNS